jgi:hypothetical protein
MAKLKTPQENGGNFDYKAFSRQHWSIEQLLAGSCQVSGCRFLIGRLDFSSAFSIHEKNT